MPKNCRGKEGGKMSREGNATYFVAWSDEDGMRYEKYEEEKEAKKRLRVLFDEQAKKELTDTFLESFLEDPYNREDPSRREREVLLRLKQEMALCEDDMVLMEDTAFLRKNRYNERFDAVIIPA